MYKREKVIIGRTEYVWLVPTMQKKIPARIDTGARTTAIWASNIHEKDGVLCWQYFATGSKFFTGEIFSTHHYDKRLVQSSTGHQETRYIIPLTLQMRGRRVRTFATLADRSHATFPILLGRNTLNGKYVVDVSHGSRKLNEIDRIYFENRQDNLKGY